MGGMTTIPLTHPLLGCARSVMDAVTEVRGVDPAYLSAGEKRAVLVSLTGAIEQLRAVQLSVMASAEDVAVDTGARSVAAWLEHALRMGYAESARAVRLGQALDRRWHVLAASFAAGRVNEAQADVIVRCLDELPDRLGPDLMEKAEAYLVEQATIFGPRGLKRLGRRILDVVAPEIAEEEERRKLEAEERAARRNTSLTMHARGDGATDIRIRVPDQVAARVKVYLEALSAPRRRHGGHRGDGDWARLPYPRQLGEAFCALVERLPSKALPQHGGTATTIMVTIPFEQLRYGLGAADLGTGERITAGEARRLACTADIVPVVLGGASEILDLGRSRRLFSPAQRKALVIRDRHCRAEGCSIPAAWCEAHHDRPWSRGGATDLKDGVLLCSWHHHRAHDARYAGSRLANGDVRFSRRT